MSEATKAVFLSYARDDAAAARRIAEALRSSGLELWFDENELRGGDSWDAKIRKQINDCTLFVALISRHTEERAKGYFRLEWKLAVEQTHLLAEGIAFLAPVVVDDTTENGAVVPLEFMRVQWTRLPGALPTPQFVEQVKRLIDAPRRAAKMEAGRPRPAQRDEGVASPVGVGRRVPAAAWGLAIAVLVALVAGALLWRRGPQPTANAGAGTPPPTAEKPSPVAADKSIAVLPFENMSADQGNTYFCDGIQEDILTNLGNIADLRVVSRTSVMQYRGTAKPIRQIAQELGVAWVLEGSVQRAGNKVRVTGQLINARTDEHAWAKAYDRDLTDIFAIQSELAEAIATALQAKLSPQEKSLISQRPTDNLAAYELVLKARELHNRPSGGPPAAEARLLLSAVQLDSNYALAYAELASLRAFAFSFAGARITSEYAQTGNLEKAKEAIDTAVRLAPESPDVIRARGDYYYYGFSDFVHAMEQYQMVLRTRPGDPIVLNRVASIFRRQGQWAESIAEFRKLEVFDPANFRNVRDIAHVLVQGRRFDDAATELRRVADYVPDDLWARFEVAYLCFVARGSVRETEDFFSRLPPALAESSEAKALRIRWALNHGELDTALRLDHDAAPGSEPAIEMAAAYAARGDFGLAAKRLGNFPAELHAQIDAGRFNARTWAELGRAEALLGHKEEALRCVQRALELVPESVDIVKGRGNRADLAFVYTWIGDKDAAVAEYGRLLRVPYGCSDGVASGWLPDTVYVMKRDPRYAPLRDDPRFEALLNDPKNNAPLF